MSVTEQDVIRAKARLEEQQSLLQSASAREAAAKAAYDAAPNSQQAAAFDAWQAALADLSKQRWATISAENQFDNLNQALQISLRESSLNRRTVTSATAYADATANSREETIAAVRQASTSGAPEYELDPARQQAIEDEELYQEAISAVEQAQDAVREMGPDAIDQLEYPEDFYDPKADAGAPPPEEAGNEIVVEFERVDNRIRIRPLSTDLRKQLYGGMGAEVDAESILAPLRESAGVLFPYTPMITFEQGVNYQEFQPTHANTSYHLYQNTPAVKFNISGKFSAQNQEEARYLLAVLHFFRTITKMRFGESTPNRGLAPPVCILSGYGEYIFNDLPIIITSFSMEMPETVNYVTVEINGAENQVPALTTISVQCVVQQTPQKHREDFNWDEFASGSLLNANRGWF